MARNYLILLVTLSFIGASIQNTSDNTVDDDSNPIADALSSIMKEQNGQLIGSMVQNFLQEQGGNILGQALSHLGKQNGGQILQGIGSMLGNQADDNKGKEGEGDNLNMLNTLASLGNLMTTLQNAGGEGSTGKSKEADSLDVLGMLGNIVGNLQNTDKKEGGGIDAGSLLQGVGSLLGGNQNGNGGIDPSTIGSLVNMFAQMQNSDSDNKVLDDVKPKLQQKPESKIPDQPEKNKSTKKGNIRKKIEAKKASSDGFDFDVGQLLSLASGFLGDQTGRASQQGFMQYLPMIMQTINAFTGSDAHQREQSHSGHAWKLPPFLEKLHLGFDHFMNSEMGKYVLDTLGAEKSLKMFKNDKGEFDYKKFGEMMENRSFRRHWIKVVTERMISTLKYVSQPEVYKTYLASGQLFLNGYLKTQGFPKSTFFDPMKPVDTISTFVNYVAKKYFDTKIQSREYVQPAVEYIQEILVLAQKKSSEGGGDSALADKLTDTINLELIEPLARVNRAYRFANTVPTCTRYVLCLVNENNSNELESLPKMKQMLYQGTSLLAAWYLSNDSDLPFWTLYTDITEPSYCKRLYKDECHGFHLEELKTTTEYVHSEL